MFERIKNGFRGLIMGFLSVGTVAEAMNLELPQNDLMARKIQEWKMLYSNNPEWLEDYDGEFISAGVAGAIASEFARLATVEFESEIVGDSKKAKYLNEQYEKIVDDLPVQIEIAMALGGMMFKPYIDSGEIVVDYVQADKFIPVAYNSRGQITSVIFIEKKIKENSEYTRLEYHEKNGTDYKVVNKAYKKALNSISNGLGEQVPLNSVSEWAELQAEANLKNVGKPLFAYFKLPIANIVDTESSLGISVFGKADDLVKQAERFWNAIEWEYSSKEATVDVSESMIKKTIDHKGNSVVMGMPKGKDRLFRTFDVNKVGDDSFYEVYSPAIRSKEFSEGYNNILKKIEFSVGLAYGTISDPSEVAKTATEIKTSKQRSFSTVSSYQKAIGRALKELVDVMAIYCDLYKLGDGEYEVVFEFGDSVLTDSQSEAAIMLQEVAAGLIRPEEYLKERYGLKTDEQAQEMMPYVDTITDSITDPESYTEE